MTEDAATTAVPPASLWPVEKMLPGLSRPWLVRALFLRSLPLALIAGLRVREVGRHRCVVTAPYAWRTSNPFRSTYFAVLAMAGELSTGALGLLATRSAPAPAAMLIVGMEGTFARKATALTTFTCEDGDAVFAAVESTLANGEPAQVRAATVGRAPDGAEVAHFVFTWSFKRRRGPAS
jgi:hypothetical protein